MEAYVQKVLEARKREADFAYSRSSIGKPVQITTPLADLLIDSCEGPRINGKLDGSCKAVFNNGRFYEGEFKDGVMHGVGRFTWTDGLIYEGEMNLSKITGRGKYMWPDGSTYSGGVVNGIRHGHGTYHSPISNTTYTGQWVDGQREGKGRLTYYSSDRGKDEEESYYDGEWKDNRQHGTGIRRYRSGSVYSGEWREGVKEGEGEMVWGGGRERYEGQWVNGKPHGHGVYTWYGQPSLNHAQHPLSNHYEGEWKNGLRDGQGSFYYASGAVYEGEWSEGLKEGRGKFTFKNGEMFVGTFHRDRMSCHHDNEGVDTVLRPQTPLGSLIGDVGPDEGRESLTDKFNVCITPLISSTHDTQAELSQVHSVVLQHITQLKKVYHFYSSLGADEPHQHSHSLTRLQFWQLLKDCRVQHHHNLSLWDADAIAAPPPPCPSATLLMREFLQSLVLLAHHLYCNTVSRGVAKCLSHFLTTHILPHACSITGTVFTCPTFSASCHQDQCWKLYQSIATSTTSKDGQFVTMRALLWRFKDSGVVPGLLRAADVVKALTRDQPLAVDQHDYNLDIKMTVLDILETVLQCCQVMSCDQSHDHCVEKMTVDQVLSQLIGTAYQS